ncbi:MAG TPA: hypothetical protein VLC09_17650 [Polyangiaceae bacterium]|nr:hypothetical protein [Polyangiaceae bacterium]
MLRTSTVTACLAALLSTACIGDGLADLSDSLLDPDAALLDRPGRKLVSGRYERLVVDGSLENGGYVLALRVDGDAPRLAIVPFLEGKACEVPSTVAYERLSSRVDVALEGLVAVQVSGEAGGKGTIRFVDFSCKERMAALDNATLPRIEFPSDAPRGLLTITEDDRLYLADAESHELVHVADNVEFGRVADNRLWTKENGKLIIRDSELKIVATLGSGLVDFVVTGGSPEVVFQDEKGLHAWSEKDDVRTLTTDGCRPFAIDTASIAYFSPCASRKLTLDVPGPKVGSTAPRVTLEGPENVQNVDNVLITYGLGETPTRVAFIRSEDPSALRGELVLSTFEGKDIPADAAFAMPLASKGDDLSIIGGNIYGAWDGTSGDLYEFQSDNELRKLADRVAQLPGLLPFSLRGVLVRYDGKVGDLVVLERTKDGASETLLSRGVPIQYQAQQSDGEAIAYVSKFGGTSGQVDLVTGAEVKTVAPSALRDTLRFLDQPKAVAYLEAKKSGDGARLHAYLIDSALDLIIHDVVSEYRPVPWPSPGLLYAVPTGGDAGIWFSKAR